MGEWERPALEQPEGWTGRRYHLETDKEIFDTKTFMVNQALRCPEQRLESGTGTRHPLIPRLP